MKFKYQLIIFSPKKRAKKVPETKKGAKGISDFKVFNFNEIKINPKIAPEKKAKNKAIIIFGKPKKIPNKKAKKTSPQPINFSLERKTIKKKKKEIEKAEKKGFKILKKEW